jgi:tetratricopeptide (TPR) repeat protein
MPSDSSPPPDAPPPIPRYPPAEEAAHIAESTALRKSANALFTISDYSGALIGYEHALAALPAYLDYELAVLRSNVAACYVKMGEWKRAVEESERGLERLDDVEKEAAEKVVEVAEGEEEGERRSLPSEEDVRRIRTKLLLRRAKAKSEIGGWAELQGAMEGKLFLVMLNWSDSGWQIIRSYQVFLP